MTPPGPAAADALYAVSPSEFVRARNALAARLRRAGHAADAAAIRRLPRPSAPLWAVNQLARRHAEGVRRFVEAVEQLRRAQLGRATAAPEATRRQRTVLNELLDRARDILGQAGLRATDEVLRRVSATLQGAAADRATQPALRAGRLSQERAAPGFEAFAGARVAPAAAGEPARRLRIVKPAREDARRDRGRDDRDAARRRRAAERAARTQAQQLERRRRELEREAARHDRAAARAAAQAETLRQQLAELERQADEERRAAEQARASARTIGGEPSPSRGADR